MKPSDRSKPAALLERFDATLNEIGAADRDRGSAQSAVDALTIALEKIGKPKFSDEAAIEKLTKARIRLPLAEEALQAAEQALADASAALVLLMAEASDVCRAILAPAVERVIDATAKTLTPLCDSPEAARQLARSTVPVRQALRMVQDFGFQILAAQGVTDPERLNSYARPFITTLRFAAKGEEGDVIAALGGGPALLKEARTEG